MLPSLGALKGVGSGLYNMGRGALFLGASKGATGAGKTMNALGHAVPLAPAVAGSFKATSNQPGFQPQSTIKTADGDSRGEPSLLRDVAEGAGYGALAGTPVGMLTGRHYADRSANDMVDFIMKGLTGTQPSHFDGVKPKHTVNATLAPVLGGAVVGGAIGGARHMYNRKKEANHPVVERALRAKVASSDWHRPVNALSYAAFAAPYLSQRVHDNHKLTTALNAAGLLGLGATSADSLANGDGLAGYDLAGLGLMGAGLVHGALRPSPTPGAGH